MYTHTHNITAYTHIHAHTHTHAYDVYIFAIKVIRMVERGTLQEARFADTIWHFGNLTQQWNIIIFTYCPSQPFHCQDILGGWSLWADSKAGNRMGLDISDPPCLRGWWQPDSRAGPDFSATATHAIIGRKSVETCDPRISEMPFEPGLEILKTHLVVGAQKRGYTCSSGRIF